MKEIRIEVRDGVAQPAGLGSFRLSAGGSGVILICFLVALAVDIWVGEPGFAILLGAVAAGSATVLLASLIAVVWLVKTAESRIERAKNELFRSVLPLIEAKAVQQLAVREWNPNQYTLFAAGVKVALIKAIRTWPVDFDRGRETFEAFEWDDAWGLNEEVASELSKTLAVEVRMVQARVGIKLD